VLVEDSGQKRHHLGGQKERIRCPLLAQGGLVAAAGARGTERATAVGWVNRDVVGQAAQPNLEGAQRLERQVDSPMGTEEVGASDRADHDRAAGEHSPHAAAF